MTDYNKPQELSKAAPEVTVVQTKSVIQYRIWNAFSPYWEARVPSKERRHVRVVASHVGARGGDASAAQPVDLLSVC